MSSSDFLASSDFLDKKVRSSLIAEITIIAIATILGTKPDPTSLSIIEWMDRDWINIKIPKIRNSTEHA